MLDLIKTSMTTSDNTTGDVIRICFAISFIFYIILQLMNWRSFHPIEFCTGVGLLFTAGSSALYIKRTTEPHPPVDKGQ